MTLTLTPTTTHPIEAGPREWLKCRASCLYFIDTYCQIYDATEGEWVPFKLWREQATTLRAILDHRLVLILKARQLGLTWLLVGYVLWLMLFHPAATVLLFSRRDDEAVHLLGFRLKGMYEHLHGIPLPAGQGEAGPAAVAAVLPKAAGVVIDNGHTWQLSNGSVAIAFPTTAGDSYTATVAVVDEADLVPNLDDLLAAVKPTIDGGGRMILLSRSDKSRPASPFKKMFLAALSGRSPWKAVFLPWFVRPGRTPQWYAEQQQDILGRTGVLDDLHEQYPATVEEALAVRTLDKRIPPDWLTHVFREAGPLSLDDARGQVPDLSYPELIVFKLPEPGRTYVLGADPAEGNPTSDDSALEVLDAVTLEEVAALAAPMQPTVFALAIAAIARAYNDAGVLVERNNHGHAVIQWLTETTTTNVLRTADANEGGKLKFGRVTSVRSKADMYNRVIDVVRPGEEQTILHNRETYLQLAAIEGATLSAPPGTHDDRAVAYGLALIAADLLSLDSFGGVHV